MRPARAVIAAPITAIYLVAVLRLFAWLGDSAPLLGTPLQTAIAFAACITLYLLAAAVIDGPGVMTILTLTILAGPIAGAGGGLLWSALQLAFGGPFAIAPIRCGMLAGLGAAVVWFAMVFQAWGQGAESREASGRTPTRRPIASLKANAAARTGGGASRPGL